MVGWCKEFLCLSLGWSGIQQHRRERLGPVGKLWRKRMPRKDKASFTASYRQKLTNNPTNSPARYCHLILFNDRLAPNKIVYQRFSQLCWLWITLNNANVVVLVTEFFEEYSRSRLHFNILYICTTAACNIWILNINLTIFLLYNMLKMCGNMLIVKGWKRSI